MEHELKTLKPYFEDILTCKKDFELRKLDRPYKVDDDLYLREYHNGEYTGRDVVVTIKYILKDCTEYGLMPGYGILGFRR